MRWVVVVPFVAGMGCLWYWFLSTTPWRTSLYLVAFSVVLAIVFEALARKLRMPRAGFSERFLLEIALAAITAIAVGWFLSVIPEQ